MCLGVVPLLLVLQELFPFESRFLLRARLPRRDGADGIVGSPLTAWACLVYLSFSFHSSKA